MTTYKTFTVDGGPQGFDEILADYLKRDGNSWSLVSCGLDQGIWWAVVARDEIPKPAKQIVDKFRDCYGEGETCYPHDCSPNEQCGKPECPHCTEKSEASSPSGKTYDEVAAEIRDSIINGRTVISENSRSEESLRCQEPTCPDYGDKNFGEGTCPQEHALMPVGQNDIAPYEEVRIEFSWTDQGRIFTMHQDVLIGETHSWAQMMFLTPGMKVRVFQISRET